MPDSLKLSEQVCLTTQFPKKLLIYEAFVIINRPGVAGAVLQTPPSLNNSLIERVTDPFPPNLQNTMCHVSFFGGASQGRVCY